MSPLRARTTAAPTFVLLMSCLLGCDSPNVALGFRSNVDASVRDSGVLDAAVDADEPALVDGAVFDDADADRDDNNDETPDMIACTSAAQCVDPDEPLCNPGLGFCVECLSDLDCTKPGEICEADGECDTPDRRN